ncbi:MAG: phenylacetate--CoA ligase family protein [Acidobacteria bacterium]|nr:MAG: phenylacetate--CoA ligase family protein [Acidobacteriota bacterium]REK01481.1 MAG: phenylacetate--CoA ligase family protein [Acidobacteriota bacterium]REK14437.1 MAG: phenylacetate--CoA ligase family protein [Acidobacteriota bacterium]REK45152.1 MAG: phenylacetate--CoA ligase family protein [Acidobacteriota bacterium]
MSAALKIYHRLPPSARNAVASVRGYYLNWWRYGARSEALVEEALERDSWNDEQWRSWQEERLEFVLQRAATRVPYYRRLWEERRRRGDKSSWSQLENWPILEKKDLRSDPMSFVADDRSPSRMFQDHTSGTTGSSLDLWLSGDTVKQWYALFEARARRWYGLSRQDRWAIFGGQLVTPVSQEDPPYWVWNSGMNQLYMSSYHISQDSAKAFVKALSDYKIKYLLGYTSAIYSLARSWRSISSKDLELKTVITNAEPVYDHQREAIAEAFGCEVRETYGMAEIVAAASECGHGTLHQWPEAGLIEENEYVDGESYEFICTGLLNADMPLVRYRVGDSGRLSKRECGCGRNLPVIETIEGRSDDVLLTRDGRRVGRMDPVFKGGLGIQEAQIIQESLEKVRVKFVPDQGATRVEAGALIGRIRERMDDIEVELEEVESIPRTERGKFRAVICNLSEEERSQAGV